MENTWNLIFNMIISFTLLNAEVMHIAYNVVFNISVPFSVVSSDQI